MFGCVTYEDDDDAQPPRHTETVWKPMLVGTHSILTRCRGGGYPRWSPEGCSVTQDTIVSKLWPLPACIPSPPTRRGTGSVFIYRVLLLWRGSALLCAGGNGAAQKRQKAIKNEDNQPCASCFALPSHWQSRQELTKSNRIMKSRRGQTGGRKCDVAVQRQPLGSVNATVRCATVRNGETADPQNNSGQHMK